MCESLGKGFFVCSATTSANIYTYPIKSLSHHTHTQAEEEEIESLKGMYV